MTELNPNPTMTLDAADPQDFTDVICGLTALGGYAASAGLDDDADRIAQLRKRLIIENRGIAEAVVEGELTQTTTGVDPETFQDGIAEILDDLDPEE